MICRTAEYSAKHEPKITANMAALWESKLQSTGDVRPRNDVASSTSRLTARNTDGVKSPTTVINASSNATRGITKLPSAGLEMGSGRLEKKKTKEIVKSKF